MDPETAGQFMKLVLATAMADGTIAEGERAVIRRLQKKLNMGDDELLALVDELRRGDDPDALLPRDADDRRKALRLMVITAQIDGWISDFEHHVLARVARRLGFDEAAFAQVFQEGTTMAARYRGEDGSTASAPELRRQADAIVQQMYRCGGSDEELRGRAAELVRIGTSAVVPLVRGFESYLRPCPPATLARLKEQLAWALGQIGDTRAVYYLATFLLMGDDEDDTNDTRLRAAVAEAVGRLACEPFARDANGVDAARAWWSRVGSRRYQTLIS